MRSDMVGLWRSGGVVCGWKSSSEVFGILVWKLCKV